MAGIAIAAALCGCAAQAPLDGPSSADPVSSAKGSEPLVLVVVGFAGDGNGENAVPYRDDFDWHAMAFEGHGVSAFYSGQSIGAFTWEPARETSAFGVDGNTCASDAEDDGVVHVKLPRGHGHWFASDGADAPQGAIDIDEVTEKQAALGRDFDDCTVDALREAAKYIDFSSYDVDGSGTIDVDELGVGIIFAGYDINGDWMYLLDEAEYPSMQSHAGGPFDIGISRGVDIIPDHAVIMGEAVTRVPEDRVGDGQVDASAIEVAPCPLSTMAHELGHYLDLPDYYDTSYNETAPWCFWNPGCLSVMGGGAVLRVSDGSGAYETSMAGFDPFSRVKLGWLQPQVVDASGTYEVRADGAPGGKNVLRVETGREGEYFLIENRQATGFDAALRGQYGQEQTGGIVVWHVDESVYDAYFEANEVNLPLHRPALTVQYLMSAGDAIGLGSGRTLSFADGTTPDTTSAFWDSKSAEGRFAELGVDAFQLWRYGEGDGADDPRAREYCGIYLTFPDESADVMHVDISLR